MFFRFISLGLVLIGVFHILSKATFMSQPDLSMLEYWAVGIATIFIGVLNFVYLYETPASKLPKIILISCNLIFIGYTFLMINAGVDRIEAWISALMTVVSSIIVLNNRV